MVDLQRKIGRDLVDLRGFCSIFALRQSLEKFLGTKSSRKLAGNTFKQFPEPAERSAGAYGPIPAQIRPDFPKKDR